MSEQKRERKMMKDEAVEAVEAVKIIKSSATEASGERIDPVCAFHGKKWSEHPGGRCLYCAICFKDITPETAAVDQNGQKWDVCPGRCAAEAGIKEQAPDGQRS